MRVLHTSLATLEPQVEAHAPAMFDVLCDPAIYEFENEPPPSIAALAAGYRRKETRRSSDGSEIWLNWVVRLRDGQLAGYVQATVMPQGWSYVGYEFASAFWRRGIATASLVAMFAELEEVYGVQWLVAVLKGANFRSLAFLRKLGFVSASKEHLALVESEADEVVMVRRARPDQDITGA